MRHKSSLLAAAGLAALLPLAGCASNASTTSGSQTGLNIVGFSVLEQANKAVFQGFQGTPAGKNVEFSTSYGASGDQSRAVAAGQKADEVHLSLEPDVTRLVDAGIVAKNWKNGATHGVCTDSVVVFVVRKGNPKHITGWNDLLKPGVKIITPNPASSGSAKWNLLAAYGQAKAQGGSDASAQTYVKKFFQHVAALPDSGRDATTAFEGGNGDVLLSYENEAILARQSGADFDYVVPDQTLLIQNPCAVTEGAPKAARDFLAYQEGKAGQTAYAKTGFRPVTNIGDVTVKGANDPAHPFPQPNTLQTIDKDFGGWDAANTKFFDDNNGILTKIQSAAGK